MNPPRGTIPSPNSQPLKISSKARQKTAREKERESASKKDRINETLKKQHTIPAPLAPSASVDAWRHRNRKGEITTTGAGAGAPLTQGAMHPIWLHTILRKRNLLTVRLEKTLLPDPSTAPRHNTPKPPPAQEQSALLPAKVKLASLGRWPGSTPWASQGAPEGQDWAEQPARAAQPPCEFPFHAFQTANTLASHPTDGPSTRGSSLGSQSW